MPRQLNPKAHGSKNHRRTTVHSHSWLNISKPIWSVRTVSKTSNEILSQVLSLNLPCLGSSNMNSKGNYLRKPMFSCKIKTLQKYPFLKKFNYQRYVLPSKRVAHIGLINTTVSHISIPPTPTFLHLSLI